MQASMQTLEKPEEGKSLEYQLAWDLFVELRKEILADQNIRITLMGAKITFVSAALAAIISNLTGQSDLAIALTIPAIIAVFFDFSINSMSFAIKRTGLYCREVIEPQLRAHAKWPKNKPLWEKYLSNERTRQQYSIIGNLGLTGIAVGAALYPVVSFYLSGDFWALGVSSAVFITILGLFAFDIYTHIKIKKMFAGDLLCELSGDEVIIESR